jgi:anti-sigma B factor antagonist
MMDNLMIKEHQIGDVTILDLKGRITLGEDSRALRTSVRRLLGDGKMKIILNMEHVGHVDSSGLGEMVAGFSTARREGGSLKLLHLGTHIKDLLVLTKLLTVFDTFENEDEAVNSFKDSLNERSISAITG